MTLIDEEEKLQYIYELADVILNLHSKCIIHWDIKPSNIMIKKKMKNEEKPQLLLFDYELGKVNELNNSFEENIVRRNRNVSNMFEGGENSDEFPSLDICL